MCDTVVVVEPGRVLFAKNSDRDPNEAQLLEWHPRRGHRAGDTLRCTWIEVPQVDRTHATLISRPFWMWGAEMGSNERGVTIGNEAVFTDQPYAATGLTGMDLLRLGLERGDSAEHALEVIVGLLGRFGQGGGCGHENRSFSYHSSFLIADAGGAFVLETAGSEWAVERVETGVRTISNGLTIPAFAQDHSDRLRTAVSRGRVRRELTARGARADPAALMALLASHGEHAWPRYSPINGAMAAPCMHAGGLLASSQTTASWVSELRDGEPGRHWATATSAPCLSLFKPVSVTEPLDLGPPPRDRFDERTLWWRSERLHRFAMRDPERVRFLPERDEVQRAWLAETPSPLTAFDEADRLVRHWSAELVRTVDRRPPWVRRYWRERDRRAELASRSSVATASAAAPS